MVDKPSVSEAEKLTKYDNKLNSIYYVGIRGRFFDPFRDIVIIRDKSYFNHICHDRRGRNRERVSTM